MKLTFLGATHEVTGSCTMIEINGHYGLVDCGMEQGVDIYVNQDIPVDASALEFVLLTHAHVDHSGMIPALYKQGYKGLIYATSATCHLCEIMLLDCAHIQESEAEWKNRKNQRAGSEQVEPVYTLEDAQKAIQHLRPCEYGDIIPVGDGIGIRFTDAGHLMGSASIEVWLTEADITKKVVFSGDIGNFNQPIIRDPQYIEEADYVITESTYGDRLHEEDGRNSVRELAEVIQRTLDRGGNVVIPSFAVGRTQEMLYFIREIKNAGMVKGHDAFPVYMDSPLANSATDIFLQCDRQYLDDDCRAVLDAGENPLVSPGLHFAISADESKAINFDTEPKVIISASGMCEAGRIKHHLKHNLWRPESTILFVGYQSNGTLGRKIVEGAESVRLFNEEISVEAEVAQLLGKSGHADMNGLIRWIRSFKEQPQMIFVNHGEDKVCESYAKLLHEEFGYTTSAPYSGAEFDLLEGRYTEFAKGVAVDKKAARKAATASGSAYTALVAAGERLLSLITRFKGMANGDLKRFTEQIDSLIDKWESWLNK